MLAQLFSTLIICLLSNISILNFFLKDHVTLTTGVMPAKIALASQEYKF